MKNKKNITGLLGGGNARLIKRFFALGLAAILTFTSTTSYAAVKDNIGTNFDSYEDMIIEATDVAENGDYALIGVPNDGLYNTNSKLKVEKKTIINEIMNFTNGTILMNNHKGHNNTQGVNNCNYTDTLTLQPGTYYIYSLSYGNASYSNGMYTKMTLGDLTIFNDFNISNHTYSSIVALEEETTFTSTMSFTWSSTTNFAGLKTLIVQLE